MVEGRSPLKRLLQSAGHRRGLKSRLRRGGKARRGCQGAMQVAAAVARASSGWAVWEASERWVREETVVRSQCACAESSR